MVLVQRVAAVRTNRNASLNVVNSEFVTQREHPVLLAQVAESRLANPTILIVNVVILLTVEEVLVSQMLSLGDIVENLVQGLFANMLLELRRSSFVSLLLPFSSFNHSVDLFLKMFIKLGVRVNKSLINPIGLALPHEVPLEGLSILLDLELAS